MIEMSGKAAGCAPNRMFDVLLFLRPEVSCQGGQQIKGVALVR